MSTSLAHEIAQFVLTVAVWLSIIGGLLAVIRHYWVKRELSGPDDEVVTDYSDPYVETLPPKFEIGDKVTVYHHTCGTWTGYVVARAKASDHHESMSGWEYEVSNAPRDMHQMYPGLLAVPGIGSRWHPLAWEEQMAPAEGT